MLVFHELKENLLNSSCLALGFFDGVHVGHQKVLSNAVNKAEELNSISTVVTFSKHPKSIITKSHTNMLVSLEERLVLFEDFGVQAAVVIDFNEKLAAMTAQNYLKKILIGCFNAKSITIGYNHKFGGDKLGCSKFLEDNGKIYDYQVSVIQPVKIDNHIVSSSAVRKFISKGDVVSAAKFLGRNFKIKGLVIHGQHLGRTLGFPTANLCLPEELIIPYGGVYSGLAKIDSDVYSAVINVGKRPTIGDINKDLVEVHILDFDKDIYGKNIEIEFLQRVRDEKKFDSLDELKFQIKKDCELVKLEQADR